jgi:hypothetical protein
MGHMPLAWQRRALIMIAALLVAECGVVARSGLTRHHPGGAAQASALLNAAAIALMVGCVSLAGIVFIRFFYGRRRRRSDDDPPEHVFQPPPASRWEKIGAVVVVVALLASPIVLVIVLQHHHSGGSASSSTQQQRPSTPRHEAGRTVHKPSGSGSAAGPAGYAALGVGVLVLVAGGVVWMRHRQAPTAEPIEQQLPQQPQPLARSVAAGARAFAEFDDARLAIIACYSGMEHALADAGVSRDPAETPVELLRRTSAAGLVRSGPARVLTGLFHEARYSDHPMDDRHRRHAAAALTELADDLRGGA